MARSSLLDIHAPVAPAAETLALPSAVPAQPVLRRSPPGRRRLLTPRLSIVIVNYRQWDRTAGLVRQLQHTEAVRSGLAEIVIVDNHSPSHPLVRKLRRSSGVSVRRWNRNHGFARAVNEGCRLSLGQWFLLLNPDIDPAEDFLDGVMALLDRLQEEERRVGIVGFHLRNSDGTQQLSTGRFPSLSSTLLGLFRGRSRRKYACPDTDRRGLVGWVTGCCLLVRRSCLEELGGLDEDYFLYYEDVDLCLRAARAGWTVQYEPDLAVVHHHPLHARSVPAVLRLVTRHSLLTYARKHWAGWQARLLGWVVRAESRCRQWSAWWRGDRREAAVYERLFRIAQAVLRREDQEARALLDQSVRRIDVRVGV